MTKTEKMFPIRDELIPFDEGKMRLYRPSGFIPWSLAEKVYKRWCIRNGGYRNLFQIADTGGFTWSEVYFYLNENNLIYDGLIHLDIPKEEGMNNANKF